MTYKYRIAVEKHEDENNYGRPHTVQKVLDIQAKTAKLLSVLRYFPALAFEHPLSSEKVRIRWKCVSGIAVHNFHSFLAFGPAHANQFHADIHSALWSSSL